jgi:hypothetical protein
VVAVIIIESGAMYCAVLLAATIAMIRVSFVQLVFINMVSRSRSNHARQG